MRLKDPVADANCRKYLKAPTWQEIENFIEILGISLAQFEHFYSIPESTLYHIRNGKRNLPKNKWHIIYEKIKPSYGKGFLEDYNIEQIKSMTAINRTKVKKHKSKSTNSGHNRLQLIVTKDIVNG